MIYYSCMNATVAGKVAALLTFLFLFSTCGDLETLFPSNGSYQVKTLVNGSSLEDCSIIRSNDKIRPYFAVSVVNDPDLIGLLVYLQNPQGEIIGDKVQYTLLAYASETALMETEIQTETPTSTPTVIQEETKPAKTDDPAAPKTAVSEEAEEDDDEDEEIDDDENEIDLPDYGTIAVREQFSFTDTKTTVKSTDIEIAVKSLAKELPYFLVPKTLEIGPYTLVFEALGKKETLSRTETNVFYLGSAEFNLKDISMYLPGLSGSQLIAPGTTVMLETRLDFDKRLDPYVVWYNGKNIISEGKISEGAGNILWQTPEQAGFYSLRVEALPARLNRANFTGVFREITLPVSPKAVSLGYFFENTPEYTARSPLAAGTAYPEQVRLITAIAAEEDSADTEEETPLNPPSPPELLQWYQFEGSLRDTMSTLTDEETLLPDGELSPRWAATGQSYGLSIEPDDTYILSPINFFREETDQGGGIFLFHIKPSAEGIIFSAFFPLRSSSTTGAWMDMIREKNAIVLRLSSGGTSVDLPVYPASAELNGFIPIVVEFYIRPYRLEAKISLGENLPDKVGDLRLSSALSGEGRIRLGGGLDKSRLDKSKSDNSKLNNSKLEKPKTENIPTVQTFTALSSSTISNLTKSQSEKTPLEITEETNIPAAVETFTSNTIWDEFAVLFSSVPLLQEEALAAAVTEQDAAKTETAETKVKEASAITHTESGSTETDNKEAAETGGDENLISPMADTNTDDSIQERETQERKTFAVLPEKS